MTTVDEWKGREAVLLQSAMRRSIRDFADHLGISPRTVSKWRAKPDAVCRPEMQQILDATLLRCTGEERSAFFARLSVLSQEENCGRGSEPGAAVVVSHKFLPLYLGGRSGVLYASADEQLAGPGGLHRRKLTIEHPSAQNSSLHVFACGAAVVHVEEHRKVSSLTDLAVWRYQTYPRDRAWAGRCIAQLLDDDAAIDAVTPEYVLSAYELREHGWNAVGVKTALHLLATPSVLVDRQLADQPVPLAPETESDRFAEGWSHSETMEFGGGVSKGVAAWSGVSYHPEPSERALEMADIVRLELDTQALWSLSSHILHMVEDGLDPVMPEPYDWRYLRGAHSRLTTARPTESTQHRMMREAILGTSELPNRLRAAQDSLREAVSE